MKNSFLIIKKILELLGIPHTAVYLNEVLDSHPEQESLLSISDSLANYKVETLAVQIGEDKLDQIPLPCVVQMIGDAHPFFSCLIDVSADKVEYLDRDRKYKQLSRKEFVSKWTGVTLLVEKGEKSSEPGYKGRKKEQLVLQLLLILLGLAGALWVSNSVISWQSTLIYSIGSLSLIALKLAGLIISAILLWTEIDKNNTAIKQFCTGGKSIECTSVLNSFSFGGIISVGNLAFAYFCAGFFLLMFTSFSRTSVQILGYLSYTSLIIVPISLYYQGIKIKKWCVLCLWISGILVLEFVVGQFLLVNFDLPNLNVLSIFSFLFLASVFGWMKLKPYFLAKNDLQGAKSKLAKFMSNRDVFDYLLSGSRKLNTKPEGMGIFLKGGSPKHHVLKVCSPFCGPCAGAHPVLEQLYEEGNIDLQIMFHPSGGDKVKLKTISHLMGIASKGNTDHTRLALDDWYLPEVKDYAVFAEKHPLNSELEKQGDSVKAMEAWCIAENITHTPTIFINGYEMPGGYAVEDLKYILV